MLKEITGLPDGVVGLSAEGVVTRDDYERVLVPLLEGAHRDGKQIRFIYQLGPRFEKMTAGGAWEDFRLGMKHLRLFERCALVSDLEWVRSAARLVAPFLPCPVRIYSNAEINAAAAWAAESNTNSKLTYEFKDTGVLTIHPHGPLRREDFDKLEGLIDPWIETHHRLNGLVVSMKAFPGWENVGSMIRHFDFVREHHREIHKVALAVDGLLPEVASELATHFVDAEIKQFPFSAQPEAEAWAAT